MNYNQLKEAIIEVIRTNGNEEITGEVLQYVLLEMVTGLGEGYAFKGVATPQTEPVETDANIFYVGGSGEYRNFNGISVDVPKGSIVFFTWNGAWAARQMQVTMPIDEEIVEGSHNPVAGGAVFEALATLVASGYLYRGIAQPNTAPPQTITAKIFYFALQAGNYANFGVTIQKGVNVIKYDGSQWSVDTLLEVGTEPTENEEKLLTSGAIFEALGNRQKLNFDDEPTEDSDNLLTSGVVYNAIERAIGQLANITLTTNKNVINVGEQTNVTINFTSDMDASAITIKREDQTLQTGTGRTLSATSQENPVDGGNITYQVVAVIKGVEHTKSVTVKKEYPVYYGAGASVSDINTKASARLTPAGRYQITVVSNGQHVFILAPATMADISKVTLSGFDFPMEAPTGTEIGGISYKSYRSANVYDAGTFEIEVYV